ncbi:hypothetical protein BGZ96_001973 [Linnemannia gamsii]|uniref:DNA-directed DNA polymerase n=1 Tax=Linnemannia gamsii TaxID=64522 RepID=A0ABQ7JLC8_9FUNG|nr:hypothetical protein BGZ96_001973 [Linnemannia gamsii]
MFQRILVYTDNSVLREVLAANGTPCPVTAGPVTWNVCRNIKPRMAPNIGLRWQYIITNGDGGILAKQASDTVCLDSEYTKTLSPQTAEDLLNAQDLLDQYLFKH